MCSSISHWAFCTQKFRVFTKIFTFHMNWQKSKYFGIETYRIWPILTSQSFETYIFPSVKKASRIFCISRKIWHNSTPKKEQITRIVNCFVQIVWGKQKNKDVILKVEHELLTRVKIQYFLVLLALLIDPGQIQGNISSKSICVNGFLCSQRFCWKL